MEQFSIYLLRWTDGRGQGWYDGRSGVGVNADSAKQYKTRRWAEARITGGDLEVVEFVCAAQEPKPAAATTGHRALLQRLADNLETEGEGGWDEDTDDRQIEVGDDYLEVRTTYEHFDDRGGRFRQTAYFRVEGDFLVDDNDDDDKVPLTDEAALQQLVNEACSYHTP